MTAVTLSSARPYIVALVAGATVMSIALGIRQGLGLFLSPYALDRGVPVAVFAFAIAVHNLFWGLAQPFAGALADRLGAAVVILAGGLVYAAGLALAALVPSGGAAILGIGVLTGIGVACMSFAVVVGAIGRATPPEKRSMAYGLAGAGGSVGQIALVPLTQGALSGGGIELALLVLAGIVGFVAPLGLAVERKPHEGLAATAAAAPKPDFRAALGEALGERGYILLTVGFFACGFQLAFITTHLPAYLVLCHMPPALGATALALIGGFNILGSWACGWLGQRFRPQYCLAWLYTVRAMAAAAFLMVPVSEASVLVFASVMGLTWLGVVPLVNGLIGRLFGVGNLGMLFGVCFFSHQIGGFLGAFLGGTIFEATGSYDLVWISTVAVGLVAAALHLPIRDRASAPALQPA